MPNYNDDVFDASGMGEENVVNSYPSSKNKEKEASKIIKVKAKHVRNLFPRYPAVLDGKVNTYGITLWEILEELEGEPFEDRNGAITVTGEFLEGIDDYKPYIILAKEICHPKWGIQYELLYYTQQMDLTKMNNQRAFLRTFLTPGQVEECYKVLENPLEVIANHDVEALKKVHGIGDYIANCIINRYEDNKDMSMVYMELDSLGLTSKFISKLVAHYKSPQKIIEVVKNNPYQLTYDVDGIGFVTADNIALKNGINPKSPKRISAFINYFLTEESEKGHSYVTAGELTANIYSQFDGKENIVELIKDEDGNVVSNNISMAIQDLVKNDIIKVEDNENKSRRRICLTKIYNLEKDIAYHLKRLLGSQNRFNYNDWETKVKKLEERQGFDFADEQRKGIKLGLDKQVCLISGLAGSGKSSLVSGILASLDKYSFAQCALSGKAAARLQEVTGQEGKTIHRLLEMNGNGEGERGFIHNENNPLPYDIIILDEISLVGGNIFLSLIKAIKTGSKLIMLGDLGQLEAIGPLSLAADMYNSEEIPTVELKQIHRQAQKSGIITSAHDVRNQIQLYDTLEFKGTDVRGELQDMIFEMNPEKDDIFTKTMEYFEKYYNSELVGKDIMKIQLISPVKERGESCVFKLNLGVQDIANPISDEKDKMLVKLAKDKEFYIQVDDKVMCIKNNYKITDLEGIVTPIYNGWTGVVKDITENEVIVDFPLAGRLVAIPIKDAKSTLILGYASTIHKLQGSDIPVVIGALDFATPPQMLTCQLVYTLLTRAKKRCVVVAQTGALRKAIATDFVSTKRTFLKEFLEAN